MTRERRPSTPDDLERIAAVRARCATGEARRIREAARITQREVAAVIGVDHKVVGRWEAGQAPTSAYALAYADCLAAMERHADPGVPVSRRRKPA